MGQQAAPHSPPRVFALSVHAGFACRHSGACCTAGWPIPVEPDLRRLLRVEVLEPNRDGACDWYDRGARRCRVHRDHGREMLPASCAHFPRRALIDERGTFVTLSHFCPTAAKQLFEADCRLEIVEAPPGFPASRQYDGLDGRDTWPPLLRPEALFDHQSFNRWERFVVSAFAIEDQAAEKALWHVAIAAERLRSWTASAGPLREWTRLILPDATTRLTEDHGPTAAGVPGFYHRFREADAFRRVAGTVPDGLEAPLPPPDIEGLLERFVAPAWHEWQAPVRRYLAAKAFGSWCAYQARGVRTMVAELMASEMVLRVEAARACAAAGHGLDRGLMVAAVRAADHLLVHLADRTAFTAWLGEVEQAGSLNALPGRCDR
jgi:hypothetical protein